MSKGTPQWKKELIEERDKIAVALKGFNAVSNEYYSLVENLHRIVRIIEDYGIDE